jgi:hypothetical protein
MGTVESVGIDVLRALYDREDATIVFHGTSTCYSEIIEQQGWPVTWRPYDRQDIESLIALGQRYNLHHAKSIYLEVNHAVQGPDREGGAYFTHVWEGAVQYAEYTGGETIRNAFNRAGFLYKQLKGNREAFSDVLQLRELQRKWKPLIERSNPVIYAVRATEREFPDVIPSQATAFDYQQREWGEIRMRMGDFRNKADVPATSIIAKAVFRQTAGEVT